MLTLLELDFYENVYSLKYVLGFRSTVSEQYTVKSKYQFDKHDGK